MTRDKIFASTLPGSVISFSTRFYDEDDLPRILEDEPNHGFSFIIIPAFSRVHHVFAETVPGYRGVFDRPLVGWISGVALGEFGQVTPKVVDGRTGRWSGDAALCLHAILVDHISAEVGIVNPFTQGDGDTITVDHAGFRIREARVNGRDVMLTDYFKERGIDGQLPLVANYSGAMVNVSIKSILSTEGCVEFYAPLFPDVDYRLARPLDDYEAALALEIGRTTVDPTLSMNCIQNFIYGRLDGKRTGDFIGPITFGEIAYRLLNQTLVYMVLRDTGGQEA